MSHCYVWDSKYTCSKSQEHFTNSDLDISGTYSTYWAKDLNTKVGALNIVMNNKDSGTIITGNSKFTLKKKGDQINANLNGAEWKGTIKKGHTIIIELVNDNNPKAIWVQDLKGSDSEWSVGYDQPNNDLRYASASSALECATKCINDNSCMAAVYAYTQPGVNGQRGCWLKSDTGNATKNKNTMLWIKKRKGSDTEWSVGYDQTNNNGGYIAASSEADCAAKCLNKNDCMAAVYAYTQPGVNGQRGCWYKTGLGQTSKNKDVKFWTRY